MDFSTREAFAVREFCDRYGICRDTFYNEVKRGRLSGSQARQENIGPEVRRRELGQVPARASCRRPGMSGRRQPEAALQRAVFQHFRARSAPAVFAFHVPNGGYRRPIEARILKGAGVVAGVPDVCVVKDGCAYFLELKTESGKLSGTQEQALAALREAGAEVAVAYGLDAALAQLEHWQLLRGVTS
jgi:VRR-NUC domain-containing protein